MPSVRRQHSTPYTTVQKNSVTEFITNSRQTEKNKFYTRDKVFLSQTVKGDETWVHLFKPESHQQSMKLHHTTVPKKKKFKSAPSARKITANLQR